ncbi:LytR/AlgR family response regulator transcription factor [Sphingobacterium zeae]|uniref:DNA-binding LytR/AlgR family response regulator n=1 Tax=Sphingobacterium zeae TaxID=1776859 RepID=A0ABU0U2R5_9SPHI|nr:LytTR family DNA-binding domain-containing protein [Sphingobacterium zeae]MDQ1149254.1 DNA-binding LytR/AlgR family response regulator [Sphingobacterium zeae]
MIKCIVIDDEQLAQEILVSHLEKIPDIEIVGVFNNAFDAMKVLRSKEINLVFCDIQMPDLDGVNFLKSLKNPPLFVFVTGDPSHAIEGYQLNVLDYILKPFGVDRLLQTIEKAQAYLNLEKGTKPELNFLIIKDRSNIIITPYDEVYSIKADKDYVWVETLEKTYHVWKKLMEMEESLVNAKQFIRVHKSYIINLDYAKQVEGNIIKMRGSLDDVPIGGQYKAELFKRLGLTGG